MIKLTEDQKNLNEVYSNFDWQKNNNIFMLKGKGGVGKSFSTNY
jgi:hypothetical protein